MEWLWQASPLWVLLERESKYLIAGSIDHPGEGGLHQSFFYKLVYSYNLLSSTQSSIVQDQIFAQFDF